MTPRRWKCYYILPPGMQKLCSLPFPSRFGTLHQQCSLDILSPWCLDPLSLHFARWTLDTLFDAGQCEDATLGMASNWTVITHRFV